MFLLSLNCGIDCVETDLYELTKNNNLLHIDCVETDLYELTKNNQLLHISCAETDLYELFF